MDDAKRFAFVRQRRWPEGVRRPACDSDAVVRDGRGEHAYDEDGFCEAHVNATEGFWPLLRSLLRPHRGISQDKLPLHPGFFQFVHDARRRGKALLGALIAGLAA